MLVQGWEPNEEYPPWLVAKLQSWPEKRYTDQASRLTRVFPSASGTGEELASAAMKDAEARKLKSFIFM